MCQSIPPSQLKLTGGVLGLQVFMLSLDAVLDEGLLKKVLSCGHSRVPVHTPGNRYDT